MTPQNAMNILALTPETIFERIKEDLGRGLENEAKGHLNIITVLCNRIATLEAGLNAKLGVEHNRTVEAERKNKRLLAEVERLTMELNAVTNGEYTKQDFELERLSTELADVCGHRDGDALLIDQLKFELERVKGEVEQWREVATRYHDVSDWNCEDIDRAFHKLSRVQPIPNASDKKETK